MEHMGFIDLLKVKKPTWPQVLHSLKGFRSKNWRSKGLLTSNYKPLIYFWCFRNSKANHPLDGAQTIAYIMVYICHISGDKPDFWTINSILQESNDVSTKIFSCLALLENNPPTVPFSGPFFCEAASCDAKSLGFLGVQLGSPTRRGILRILSWDFFLQVSEANGLCLPFFCCWGGGLHHPSSSPAKYELPKNRSLRKPVIFSMLNHLPKPKILGIPALGSAFGNVKVNMFQWIRMHSIRGKPMKSLHFWYFSWCFLECFMWISCG